MGNKQELLQIAKQAYDEKLFAGTSGNLSSYNRQTGIMTITPSSIKYTTMTVEDIVEMRLDGEIVSGHRKPSSEWQMHALVYKEREDISSVVHTHSPYATSFAVIHEEIPVILIEMVPFLGGSVPLADFGLPGSIEIGEEALKALVDGKNACLMANHGVLAVGGSLEQTYTRAIYVEDAAKIYSLSLNAGRNNIHLIPEEHIRAMQKR